MRMIGVLDVHPQHIFAATYGERDRSHKKKTPQSAAARAQSESYKPCIGPTLNTIPDCQLEMFVHENESRLR